MSYLVMKDQGPFFNTALKMAVCVKYWQGSCWQIRSTICGTALACIYVAIRTPNNLIYMWQSLSAD